METTWSYVPKFQRAAKRSQYCTADSIISREVALKSLVLYVSRCPLQKGIRLLEEHGDQLHAAGKAARLLDRITELLSDGNLKVTI